MGIVMPALSSAQRYCFFDGNLPMVRRAHRRLLTAMWVLGVVCGAGASLGVGVLWDSAGHGAPQYAYSRATASP